MSHLCIGKSLKRSRKLLLRFGLSFFIINYFFRLDAVTRMSSEQQQEALLPVQEILPTSITAENVNLGGRQTVVKRDQMNIQHVDKNIIETNIEKNIETNIERNIETNIERNIETNIEHVIYNLPSHENERRRMGRYRPNTFASLYNF